jgi:cytochrome c-type biogenesis protein CcmH
LNRWIKTVQAMTLAIAVYFSVGATGDGARFENLGHRLMCTCGCAELLGECNHVGCPESTRMRNELASAIAAGKSDREILAWFSDKYGRSVQASPRTHGFELVAWIAPFAVFAAGLLGTILLIRRWIRPVGELAGGVNVSPVNASERGHEI